MATNIPPHNLGEVIDGVVMMIDNQDVTIKELMTKIKGPDFPTAGIILGKDGIRSAYETGRGKIKVRAKAEIEEMNGGKSRIVVTEIPYLVNKSRLIEKIADLVRDKKVEGISDLRDESDREGMRIVIEIKRDANANVILNQLYKHTQLEDTFGVIMLALVDGEPKVLNLKEVLKHYLDFQKEVIERRTRYDLNKAEARAHILEGLRIALDNIDEVINIIRSSKTVADAKQNLTERFGLTEVQSQAIVDMRLARLTGLERDKIEEEYAELIKTINYLKEVLANERLVYQIIREEILEIKKKYSDARRTKITRKMDDIDIEDLIQEEDVVITLTHFGYIKRLSIDTYTAQKRGGKGIVGLSTREDDVVENLFITSTHNNILFFTNQGRVYKMKAFEIPEASRQAKGIAIVNLLQLNTKERIQAVMTIKEFEDNKYLTMVTKNGIVKRCSLTQFKAIRKNGLNAINLKPGDELIGVRLTDGDEQIIIVTANGYSIRFKESDVRPMGRAAAGVKGITLREGDIAVGMDLVSESLKLLTVSEKGFGKRTSLKQYTVQGRGGKGIKTYKVTKKTGNLVGARVVDNSDEILLINNQGTVIRLNVADISETSRNTLGVTLMRAEEDVKVVSIAKINNDDNDNNGIGNENSGK
jgi:DNA gyrase subunit A